MVVNLADRYHIIFRADHPNYRITEKGTLDCSKVSRIKIMGIE